MRRIITFAVLLLCAYSFLQAQKYQEMIDQGTFTLEQIKREAERHFDVEGRGKGSGYKQYKRWEYTAERELDDNGVRIPIDELAKRSREYKRSLQINGRAPSPSTETGNWQELGPTYWVATSGWNPGVGRVTDVSVDATNPNHFIVSTPGGGVWKTTNAGTSWTPLCDDFGTMDGWAVAINPSNSNVYLWGGNTQIYKSNNGGQTWTTTTKPASTGKFLRIVYHPTNHNIVFAVAEYTGLYRSTNGGDTWVAVAGTNDNRCFDIAFKPGDPNTVYYCSNRFRRSTDGGISFTEIGGFNTNNGRHKKLAVTPANPNIVYVLEANGGRFGGFYRSTNSGQAFTRLIDGATINYFGYSDSGNDDRGQAPRDMAIAASNTNANEVHIGGIHTWRSTNGGTSFQLSSFWTPGGANQRGVGYNHADIDNLRSYGNTLYVCSDGGIFISTDGGVSFVDKTTGMGIREFYRIGVSKTDPNLVSGGSQDNGTSVMRGQNRDWRCWLGADGMETFVDWANPNNLYGTTQNGNMNRSTNMGNTRNGITGPGGTGAWVTPFEQDPTNSAVIYVAYAEVFRSDNRGNGWTQISNFGGGNCREMKIAPSNNQVIYVAKGSTVYRTNNGGGSWTTLAGTWGGSNVSFITINPKNPNKVIIVTNNNVFLSENGGGNWTSINAGLPNSTKYCAIWEDNDKDGIYVGGLGFIMYRDNTTGGWKPFMTGLPNVRVYELEINYVSKKLFAGTYGRGLWESDLYSEDDVVVLNPPIAQFTFESKAVVCGGPLSLQLKDESLKTPTSWEWTFQNGTPASSTAQNPTVVFSTPGLHNVTLKVTNEDGEDEIQKVAYVGFVLANETQVANMQLCGEGDVELVANTNSGNVNWYAGEADTEAIYSGNSFTTPVLSNTSFYYDLTTNFTTKNKLGKQFNVDQGGTHAGNFFSKFIVQKQFTLKSALVYAYGTKERTVVVRNGQGNVVEEKIVNLQDGLNRVELDLTFTPGEWQIGFAASSDIFRSNSGVNYPYTIDGVLSIYESSANDDAKLNFFYYLYDWEIEYEANCVSNRKSVEVIVVNPTLPSTENVTVCQPGEAELFATSQQDELIHWYTSSQGGEAVHKGESFTTFINNDTTFYVSTAILDGAQQLGHDLNNGSGDFHGGNFYTIFDAEAPFTLVSAVFKADFSGNRTIVLRNSEEQIILSKAIMIPEGENRVEINMEIPAGNNLQLGVSGPDAGLFRHNVGVNYPYAINNLVNLKSSTAPEEIAANFYYYLYDMEVQSHNYCASERTPVKVVIDICTSTEDVSAPLIQVYPNPSSDMVTIEAEEMTLIKILNTLGAEVLTRTVANNQERIDISHLSTGHYYIQITYKDGNISTEKLQKL